VARKLPRNEHLDVLEATQVRPPDVDRPVLFPETQVSRQYAFHVLQLPGQPEPTWHRYLAQAIEHADHSGYATLTLVIAETQYRLSKID